MCRQWVQPPCRKHLGAEACTEEPAAQTGKEDPETVASWYAGNKGVDVVHNIDQSVLPWTFTPHPRPAAAEITSAGEACASTEMK
jgi:hypothetical protein